jgi:hypothetical protein
MHLTSAGETSGCSVRQEKQLTDRRDGGSHGRHGWERKQGRAD